MTIAHRRSPIQVRVVRLFSGYTWLIQTYVTLSYWDGCTLFNLLSLFELYNQSRWGGSLFVLSTSLPRTYRPEGSYMHVCNFNIYHLRVVLWYILTCCCRLFFKNTTAFKDQNLLYQNACSGRSSTWACFDHSVCKLWSYYFWQILS